VVGAGYMGRLHILKVADLERQDGDVRLVAVVEPDPARAEEIAKETGARVVAEIGQILPEVDAVVVAVPTVEHFAVVEAALAAGVDVLVEKPIAARVEEAEKLLATAREGGRILQVGHLEWFNSAMREVKDSIDRPRFIEAHRLGPFPDRGTDVDVVRDLMIHDIDIIQRLLGEEPERIESIGVPVISERADIANARLTFPSGCVANLTASRVSPTRLRKIRFFQPDAYFSIDLLDQNVVIARRGAADETGQRQISLSRLDIDREDALVNQLRSFREAVASRRVAAGAGGDGLVALRTALRVIEAMPPIDELQ